MSLENLHIYHDDKFSYLNQLGTIVKDSYVGSTSRKDSCLGIKISICFYTIKFDV